MSLILTYRNCVTLKDSRAYGVLTLPVPRVKCFGLQQVDYGGFHYDRLLLVEICLGIAEYMLCPYMLVLCWWLYLF
jgi:hypothetical protein